MERIRDKEKGIDWRPQWEGADLVEVERLEAEALSRNFVRELRKRFNLTQVELAQLLQLTQAGVSKLEKRPSVDTSVLEAIAKSQGGRLNISIDLPDGESVDLGRLVA